MQEMLVDCRANLLLGDCASENNMEIEQVYLDIVLYPTFMSVFTILGSTTMVAIAHLAGKRRKKLVR